jgi:hypothetical protein
MTKSEFNKKRALFTSKLDLEPRKKLVKCYFCRIAIYGAETWTFRAVDQKHLVSFEMWCWRRMWKISWTDHDRNAELLLRVEEQRNILHEIRKRKAIWTGHILRRNCLLLNFHNFFSFACLPVFKTPESKDKASATEFVNFFG